MYNLQDLACYRRNRGVICRMLHVIKNHPHNLKKWRAGENFAKISPLLEKNGAVFEKIGGGANKKRRAAG